MALTIIHVPCFDFFILNESKNWTLNATAAARKKFGVTGQSTTDAVEIRRGKSTKFDGAPASNAYIINFCADVF